MAWRAVTLDPLVGALKGRRKALRITQEELSRRIGVAQSNVCAWERGRKLPSLPNLHKWCAALGVELGLWEEPDAEA